MRLKSFLLGVLAALTVLFMGQSNPRVPMDPEGHYVAPGLLQSHRPSGFTRFGGTTATFSAATTTPDATHRTYATFDDDTAVKTQTLDSRWVGIILRMCSPTENEVNVFDVFGTTGTSDHWSRIGTLTWTTGTATSNVTGSEFADTCVVTNEDGVYTWVVASPADSVGTAWAMIDAGPFDRIGLVPTTLASSAVAEICGF